MPSHRAPASSTFGLSEAALRRSRGAKWTRYGPDVLPAWVADMDFATAPAIAEAVKRVAAEASYCYIGEERVAEVAASFAERMAARFGWSPQPDQVVLVADLVQAITALAMAFTKPGDRVVITPPIYPPFLSTVADTGREAALAPLTLTAKEWELDTESVRRKAADAKLLLLCNPHNPTGRVFRRDELLELAQIALDHDLIVVSDEIHADLVYDGAQHIPFATLGDSVAERVVTITSATKSFNIPALRLAVMHFGTPELRDRFHDTIPSRLLGQPNLMGIEATIAAWRHGQDWLDTALRQLQSNRERLGRFLAAEIPAIDFRPPESTYLAWLDCSGLSLTPSPFEFFLRKARVAFSDGITFGPSYRNWIRMNFGTTDDILEQIMERMRASLIAT